MLTLTNLRRQWQPTLPLVLHSLAQISFAKGARTAPLANEGELKKLFPQTLHQPLLRGAKGGNSSHSTLRIGVLFSGGPAPGGHNVVIGLWDALKTLNPQSSLIGFLGGPSGFLNQKVIDLTEEKLRSYQNQGGFDLLGSGRTKIEKEEDLQTALQVVKVLNLDGLVVIGGDDSNTNAALLSEYFLSEKIKTRVVGVPKTIDGDLQNPHLQISFGFDTACKVYTEAIGNIARDSLSSRKYYHFIRIMGRSASHIALECALVNQPNLTLISEEISAHKRSLKSVVTEIAHLIQKRAQQGKEYGIILIPEGLFECIPDATEQLLSDCNLDHDSHGNIHLSSIETERVLASLVKKELGEKKINTVSHYLGYEGRASLPSLFDSNYCYALGHVAALLVDQGHTGYMSCLENLTAPVEEWAVSALPITMFMHLEKRKGEMKPVIRKALVDLDGNPFQTFASLRKDWELSDAYQQPGPIQFFGETQLISSVPKTLALRK